MTQNQSSPDMKDKIVDSHCHLDFDDFNDDLSEVINNARQNNVEYMLSISVDFEKFVLIPSPVPFPSIIELSK